ncbi:MAG: EamA family transporter [Candidatus Omnitrophica bacterium]|nr:EamA family transporter [Candidatus Omnitrophota bacterium]
MGGKRAFMLSDWQVYALGSAIFAGLTAVFAKVGVTGLPSNTATLIRTIVIIMFLIVLVAVRREWVNPFSLSTKSFVFLVLSALATGLSWICYFRALQIGQASLVTPIDKLSLLFAVLLSVLFLGERLSLYQWGGVVLMSLGALLVAFK